MKKSTKKMIMALIIVLIFGLSSVAFFATGFFGTPQQQQQIQQLPSPIVEGEIDATTENAYIQGGFTWLKYYHTDFDLEFSTFIDSLPQSFQTPNEQTQLIVQKISSAYLNKTKYIVITSVAGQESFSADKGKTIDALCRLLTITPVECLFRTGINATNSSS